MSEKVFIRYLIFFIFFSAFSIFLSRADFNCIKKVPYNFFGEYVDFELPDQNDVLHKISDYRGQECIICFIKSDIVDDRCRLESYFSDINNWLAEKNIKLICVSTELLSFDEEYNKKIPFLVLIDKNDDIVRKYYTSSDDKFSLANMAFILDKYGAVKQVLAPEYAGDLAAQIMVYVISNAQGSVTAKAGAEKSFSTDYNPLAVLIEQPKDFQLFDHSGKLVKLSDYRGRWCLVSFANKISGVFVYEKFLNFLKAAYPWFKKQNVEIVCACTQSVQELEKIREHMDLNFTLLSDQKCVIPQVYDKLWYFYNKFLSMLIDPDGVKITTFVSESPELHFAQLCKYFISK